MSSALARMRRPKPVLRDNHWNIRHHHYHNRSCMHKTVMKGEQLVSIYVKITHVDATRLHVVFESCKLYTRGQARREYRQEYTLTCEDEPTRRFVQHRMQSCIEARILETNMCFLPRVQLFYEWMWRFCATKPVYSVSLHSRTPNLFNAEMRSLYGHLNVNGASRDGHRYAEEALEHMSAFDLETLVRMGARPDVNALHSRNVTNWHVRLTWCALFLMIEPHAVHRHIFTGIRFRTYFRLKSSEYVYGLIKRYELRQRLNASRHLSCRRTGASNVIINRPHS